MPEVDLDVGPRVQVECRCAFDRSDAKELLGRDDIAPKLLPARRAFELAELLERVDAHVRVRADAERNPPGAQPFHRNEPVAEVGLRGRTHADAGARLREEVELVVVRVGSVDDRRPRAEAAGALEELDRPDAVLCEALLDLAGLLVGMHVEHKPLALGVPADLLEPLGRTSTDGVGGDANPRARRSELGDLLEVGGHRLLPETVDSAPRIRDMEEHELHAGGAGGFGRRLRLLEADVVELADRGVARVSHLAVRALVTRAHGLRGQGFRLLEHGVPPAPEVVPLGAAPHRPLERVAVRVDETREREPVRHRREATILREVATRAVSTPLAQLPNALTVARLAIIPIFVALVIQAGGEASWAAGILFGIAGITDQVDGWLARRWSVESQFGRFVDPLADRIIIDAAVILLWYYDRLPWPALALILIRDGILIVGTPAAIRRGYEFSVSFLGKAATWVLYASIAFILVTDPGTDWPLALFWAGVGLAVAAGLLYVVTVWRTTR
jgi:CDP-diacylglycerol--glycerol-3-phosphate 3-phosphatidyltransferase